MHKATYLNSQQRCCCDSKIAVHTVEIVDMLLIVVVKNSYPSKCDQNDTGRVQVAMDLFGHGPAHVDKKTWSFAFLLLAQIF